MEPRRPACTSIDANLDAYDADRADFERLLAAIRKFQAAPVEKLAELEWVHEVVCSVGVHPLCPAEEIYADAAALVNPSNQGITQYPLEFARWLVMLGEARPASYLEIGCYNGATACLATGYLHRLNPSLRAATVDVVPWFFLYPQVRDLIPLEYYPAKTSYDFRGENFDAVFIDADHSFPWALADFLNVGERARICGMHDVKSRHFFEQEPLGGVTAVWELIKRDYAGPGIEITELFDHPTEYFGIGVRERQIF